ncbi:hypothetical protein CEXT_379821, partial [Caerostris extrusa]
EEDFGKRSIPKEQVFDYVNKDYSSIAVTQVPGPYLWWHSSEAI